MGNEHKPGGEHEEEHGNPVATGLAIGDYTHLTAEAAIEGGTEGASFAELAHEMGMESAEVWAGGGSTAQTGLAGATAVMAPMAIAGGVMEVIEGINDWDGGKGAVTVASGGLTAGSGVAALAGLGGSSMAAALAPVIAAGATGLKIGQFGDDQVKKRGWLHDDEGNAESASEWAADQGQAAYEWVSDHVCGPAGTVAGLATTLGASIPGAALSVGAAAASAGEFLSPAVMSPEALEKMLEEKKKRSSQPRDPWRVE